jgi:hypothetical protein
VYLTCQALGAAYRHPLLTAYLTAYGLRKKLPNGGGQETALNSASLHSVDWNRVTANQ